MQPATSDHQRTSVDAAPLGFHLDAHLEAVEAFAAETVISAAARARLRTLGPLLPPFRHGIFECRLEDGAPQVDFCCKYSAADLFSAAPPANGAIWERLASLRGAWRQPDLVSARGVDLLGLEFDLDGPVTAQILPGVFFAFSTDDFQVSALALEALAASVQRASHQSVPSGDWRDGLRHCAEALSAGSHLNYAGLMLGREPGALRIGVEGLAPPSAIPDYLERIGWRGPVHAVRTFLARLPAPLQRSVPVVALDISASVGRRIGLEFLLCHPPAVQERRTEVFLDHLVTLGWCSPEKRAAVLNWPEASPAPAPALNNEPSWRRAFLRPAATPRLHRIVSHIKLSWFDGAEPQAKVYLETTDTP